MALEDTEILVVGGENGISSYLEGKGAQVTVEPGPGEGLTALESNEYDAVIGIYSEVEDSNDRNWDGLIATAVEETDGRYITAPEDLGYEVAVSQVEELLSTRDEYEQAIQELEAELDESETWRQLVNHDIKNPMNIIQGRVELAEEKGNYEEVLEIVASQTERVLELLERESNARKMTSSGERRDYSTEKLLKDSIESCSSLAKEKNINLLYDSDESYTVRGISYLEEGINNIVSNAVRHSEGRLVSLWAEARNGEVDIVIEDDGVGIPEEKRESVLELGEGRNTGIGLYVSSKAAEASGGELVVGESEWGGARFTLTLRRSEQTPS